jgi:hypothetical protein
MAITLPTRVSLACCAALALASCTTQDERSDLVLTNVLVATSTPATATAAATCSCPVPGGTSSGTTFSFFVSFFQACLVVENRLPNNAGNLRLNTNDLILETVRIQYSSADTSTVNVPDQITPISGTVKVAGALSVGAVLVPQSIAAQLPAGGMVRVHVYVEGRLLDGSKVKTSAFDYLVQRTTGTPAACGG